MKLADLKARMQQLNQRGAKKANDIWKPKDEHEIRVLPYPHSEDPFITLYFHYELGDQKSILCPKANYGEECDVCDFADMLKSWKTPEGNDKPELERKSDFEIFKKIQAKPRVFLPMVERGKEEEGAKFWGITPNQAQELLEFCTDSDRLEACGLDPKDEDKSIQALINPLKAFDLKISFAKPGEKGNTKSFPQTKIDIKFKPSALHSNKETVKKLLDSVKNIKDVYPTVTSGEISKILKVFLNSEKAEAKPDGGVEYGKKETKTNSTEKADKVGGRSIEDAFGDMLKE